MASIQADTDLFITIQVWNKIVKFNLGDDLNYYLMKELTGRRIVNYNNMWKWHWIRHYSCIGSIFDWCVDANTTVWGTGDLFAGEKEILKPKTICAVRGPLTRQVLIDKGIDCPALYGDPAMLLPCVYVSNVQKKYKLGIIPHYDDFTLDNIKALLKEKPQGTNVIRMSNYNKWTDVIDEICQCECIASSSLHGLIIADAYNIPNIWIKMSNKVTGGGGTFKYQDYFASVGRENIAPIDFVGKA